MPFVVGGGRSEAYKVEIKPANGVYVDEPYLSIRWDAQQAGLKRLAFVTAPSGLGKVTIEDVSGLVDHNELQSRTFDSMAAARQWVSEAFSA